MDRLCLTHKVYDEIAETIGSAKAEQGGALGWREDEQVVRFFRFDETARSTGATYSPDDKSLNAMFKKDWNPRGIRLAGFVHSHPPGFARPSAGDLAYAERILAAIPDLPYLVLPIVQTVPDTGAFRLVPFLVSREGGHVQEHRVDLVLIEDQEAAVSVSRSRSLRKVPSKAAGKRTTSTSDPREVTEVTEVTEVAGGAAAAATAPRPAVFDRLGDAYDLDRLARSRIVAVGVGGAASFIEDLARSGVGEFVLIDPDVIAESNVATQQVYLSDIGRLKVDALGQRLRDINPAIRVREVSASLDDLDDSAMRGLCQDPIGGPDPLVTLLCGLTDNFFAQARINALALNLMVPSLCAQVWREGRGAEITFTYPGLTPACHRCMLASRYRAYLSDGYANDVTSRGTPIFATSRLNSIKGFLAIALLHHRPDEPPGQPHDRYGRLAARIGSRNMLQIRMDPDLSDVLGIRTFDRVFEGSDQASLLFDETVWRAQDPESGVEGNKPCPDCGGTGDLRDSSGTFTDTRRIRPEER